MSMIMTAELPEFERRGLKPSPLVPRKRGPSAKELDARFRGHERTESVLQHPLHAGRGCGIGDDLDLLFDGLREFLRPTGPHDLSRRADLCGDLRIAGGRHDVGRHAVAQRLRHVARPEQADQPIDRQPGMPDVFYRRHVGARSLFVIAMSLTFPACTCGRTMAYAAT